MATVEQRIGARLKLLRMHLQWTQEDFGKLIGTRLGKPPWSGQVVSVAEKGGRAFTAAELVAIGGIFGITLDQLVRETPECGCCRGVPPHGFTCNTCGKTGE